MPLRKTMPMTPPAGSKTDTKHETTYQASRGGWYTTTTKPVPGTPKGGAK
ncbi:hypothetical protein [Streptomyces microflavus]|uniref:Uncharacterized protein n=1 Tax=Streptomyces microflavus TaxID=1919 RepID=A0A7H8N0Y2_STRMI|nr:hypothetical protein [Streptomyces microflavus]QKW48135.1 hypothetical protein HUT09_37005 [Streptomyces microflavus]